MPAFICAMAMWTVLYIYDVMTGIDELMRINLLCSEETQISTQQKTSRLASQRKGSDVPYAKENTQH